MTDEVDPMSSAYDRRDAARAIALFRPAIIQLNESQTFCLVRNISSTGLMATVHSKSKADDDVLIHFSEAIHVSGKVIWTEDDRVGVKFDTPIVVGDFLAELASQSKPSSTYRSPRLQVSCEGKFIVHADLRDMKVLDVSQRGVKVEIAGAKEGEEGVVALPGLAPRRSVVRWSSDGVAGLYFIDPIGFTELGRWIMSLSSEGDDRS